MPGITFSDDTEAGDIRTIIVAATFMLRKWLIYSRLIRRLKPANINFGVFAVKSSLVISSDR